MLTDQERVDLAVRVLSERERSTEPGDVELCTLARAVLAKELTTIDEPTFNMPQIKWPGALKP